MPANRVTRDQASLLTSVYSGVFPICFTVTGGLYSVLLITYTVCECDALEFSSLPLWDELNSFLGQRNGVRSNSLHSKNFPWEVPRVQSFVCLIFTNSSPTWCPTMHSSMIHEDPKINFFPVGQFLTIFEQKI